MKNKIERVVYFICFAILFYGITPAFALNCSTTIHAHSFGATSKIEHLFKTKISPYANPIYSKVPRGLVISFDSRIFFDNGQDNILENSKPLLHTIAQILKELPNECMVEGHSDNEILEKNYSYLWELTTVRAEKIVDYLIKEEHVNSLKIYAAGFGEFMPYSDNVNSNANLNKRIDFVIINYEKLEPLIKQ